MKTRRALAIAARMGQKTDLGLQYQAFAFVNKKNSRVLCAYKTDARVCFIENSRNYSAFNDLNFDFAMKIVSDNCGQWQTFGFTACLPMLGHLHGHPKESKNWRHKGLKGLLPYIRFLHAGGSPANHDGIREQSSNLLNGLFTHSVPRNFSAQVLPSFHRFASCTLSFIN